MLGVALCPLVAADATVAATGRQISPLEASVAAATWQGFLFPTSLATILANEPCNKGVSPWFTLSARFSDVPHYPPFLLAQVAVSNCKTIFLLGQPRRHTSACVNRRASRLKNVLPIASCVNESLQTICSGTEKSFLWV